MSIERPHFPIFKRPEDPETLQFLKAKAEQYEEWRKQREEKNYITQRIESSQKGYEQLILGSILELGKIETEAIARVLFHTQGAYYSGGNFIKACEVIAKYLNSPNHLDHQ